MATVAPAHSSAYPVRYDVAYPERLSRLLIFVKLLLAIPHLIILYFLNIAFGAITLVALIVILFTKRYPDGLFGFAVGIQRWSNNVNAYVMLLRDEYPPFSMDAGQYAVAYDVDPPGELNRFLPLIKWLLVLPNIFVLGFVMIAVFVTTLVSWFAILFTGRYPRSLFDFAVGAFRWQARANGYAYLFTDRYPPFSLKP